MIDILYLRVTENCNLSCPFCFVKKNTSVIDIDKCIETIDTIKPNRIIFHGGEPLLYPKLIRELIDTFPNIKHSITTNLATNLSDQSIDVLHRCDVSTSYSIDRFSDINEFNKFLANVNTVGGLGRQLTVLVTLSDRQINQPAEQLCQLLNTLPATYISFERLYFTEQHTVDYLDDFYHRTDLYLSQCFRYIRPQANTVRLKFIDSIKLNKPVFPTACSDNVRTLTTDGTLFSCPSIQDRQIGKRRRQCISCNLYKYCQGDCQAFRATCCFPKQTFRAVLNGEL